MQSRLTEFNKTEFAMSKNRQIFHVIRPWHPQSQRTLRTKDVRAVNVREVTLQPANEVHYEVTIHMRDDRFSSIIKTHSKQEAEGIAYEITQAMSEILEKNNG